MKTRMISFNASCLFLVVAITLCEGAPVPKPPPPKVRATLRSGGCSWIVFSPDGKMLASAGNDKTIKLWDVAKGEEIASLSGHTGPVTGLTFSPDGKLLASSSRDYSLRLWDVGKRKSLAVLAERAGDTKDLIFSPDGKTLVSGSGYSDFWDIQSKKRIKQVKLSPNGQLPVPTTLGYNADGKLLTVVWPPHSRTTEVWDVIAGKCLRKLEYPKGGELFQSCVAFTSDYKVLAFAWSGICLWDIPSGKLLGNYELKRPDWRITGLAFSPDCKLLATAWQRPAPRGFGMDGVISILDPATCKELANLEGHTQPILHMVFSPDGRILASAGCDQTVKLWDVRGVKAAKKD